MIDLKKELEEIEQYGVKNRVELKEALLYELKLDEEIRNFSNEILENRNIK